MKPSRKVKVYHAGHWRWAELLHIWPDGDVLARLLDGNTRTMQQVTVPRYWVRGADLDKLAQFVPYAMEV